MTHTAASESPATPGTAARGAGVRPRMWPWTDRAGRLSPVKILALAGSLAPALWLAWLWLNDELLPKPVTEAIHFTGAWSLRLLLVTLAITPLRVVTGWNGVIAARRLIGLAALGYGLGHLALYIVDQKGDLARIASEIVSRFYLTIGFAALLVLIALGVTSFDSAIRRLGGEVWGRLHRLIYPATAVIILHGALQSKIDVSEPMLMAGLFLLAMGLRRLRAAERLDRIGLCALALGIALATAALEIAWYGLMTGVDPWRIAAANLDPENYGLRPAALAGLGALAVAGLWEGFRHRRPAPRRKPALA